MNRRSQAGTDLVSPETQDIVDESLYKIKGYLQSIKSSDPRTYKWLLQLCSKLAKSYTGEESTPEYGLIYIALGMFICDCENDAFWRTMFGIDGPEELSIMSQAFSSGTMPRSELTGTDKQFNARRSMREAAQQIINNAMEAARNAQGIE